MKRILLFSPFQGIPQHSFIEKKIGELLVESGGYAYDVIVCDGFLSSFCTVMASNGLSFFSSKKKKDEICRLCKRYRNSTHSLSAKNVYTLEAIFSEELLTIAVNEKKRIQIELENYSYDGVNIGRISSYEMLLGNKLKSISPLSENLKKEYARLIFNNLKVYLALKEFFKKRTYDFVLFYNGNYIVNNTVINLLQRHYQKTESILIHYGLNWAKLCDKIFVMKTKHQDHLVNRINFFEKNLDKINFENFRNSEVDEYLEALFSAKSAFVYSTPRVGISQEVFQKIGLSSNKPTAMMSIASLDEIYALQFAIYQSNEFNWVEKTFDDQIKWIEETVDFFRKNPQWQLIIRVHPREFPNKREKIISSQNQYYEKLAQKLPENVRLNLPIQNISIYDLFEIIFLHLTSWSSVGLESSALGVPTISTVKGIGLYPTSYVNFFSSDPDQYFNKIRTILSGNKYKDFRSIECAKKWLLYEFNQTVIKVQAHPYFEKKSNLLIKVLNKVFSSIPLWSYARFKKNFTVDSYEKKCLLQFFQSGEDVFVIKNKD